MTDETKLSRRQRQIMDVLYARGTATAAEVQSDLPDPPSYSAVRALLAKMESRDLVQHHQDGPRYVYKPKVAATQASGSAIDRLIHTFFGGSAARAATSLLGRAADEMSARELSSLEALIREARQSSEAIEESQESSSTTDHSPDDRPGEASGARQAETSKRGGA